MQDYQGVVRVVDSCAQRGVIVRDRGILSVLSPIPLPHHHPWTRVLGLYSAMPVVYLCIVAASVISSLFKDYNYKNMIFSGLISVGVWHILVNLAVWISGIQALPLSAVYIAAIPFDLRLLASTLIFSSLFFGFRSVFLGW